VMTETLTSLTDVMAHASLNTDSHVQEITLVLAQALVLTAYLLQMNFVMIITQ